MTIDPGRRTAAIAAITALNSKGLLADPVRREALAGAIIIADAAGSDGLANSSIEQVLAELDHIIYNGGRVLAGHRVERGYSRTALLAAIA